MDNKFKKQHKEMGEVKVSQIKRLGKYAKPYKKQIAVTVTYMMIATITGLLGPYLLRYAIDDYIPNENFNAVVVISGIFLVALIVNYICNRKKIAIANLTGQSILLDIRRDLFDRIQTLSFRFFDKTSTGRLIVCVINDVNRLNDLFTDGLVNVITDLSMLVVAAVIMVIIHPGLALLTFTTVPIFLIVLFMLRNYIKTRWRDVRIKLSNLNAYIHECIVGMRVIQAYVRQAKNRKKFERVSNDIFHSWMKAVVINTGFGPLVNFVAVLGSAIIYWYGAYLLQIEGVTIGVIIAFTVYLQRFWDPVNTLSNFYNQLLIAMASSERIFEFIDEKPDVCEVPDATYVPKFKGKVVFENVHFAYEPDKPVLENVSFSVSPGETIAIVGPTGSGKSTIINLLTRFYDITAGNIKIDNYDIKEITLATLRERIGVMLQEPFIFSGSIKDNIMYGKADAKIEEVIQVAKAVSAHEFIVQMEQGYDTMVNERGSRLSIGQKQLVAFARVLLRNPDILILDEATASVDTHTEKILQKAIDKLLEGRTSFVIAHRLSTIRNADRIMVIDKGRIAQMGSHDELMAQKGLYYQLYEVQYKFLDAL